MTTTEPSIESPQTHKPSLLAQMALHCFITADRARVSLARKERALRKALRYLDLSDESPDLAWYYVESQKILDGNDLKIVELENDL